MKRFFIFILLGFLTSTPLWADSDPEADARDLAEQEAQHRAEQEQQAQIQKLKSDNEALIKKDMESARGNGQQMSDEQMQQMMEGAGKMQECMAKIDQKDMDAITAKSEKVNGEIKKLCAAGKRDEAQITAMDYGKEMAASKEMQAMQQCGMANQMAMTDPGEKPGHVCDGM